LRFSAATGPPEPRGSAATNVTEIHGDTKAASTINSGEYAGDVEDAQPA